MFVNTSSLRLPPSRLLSLPEEILIHILSLIGTPALLRCRALCRQIKCVIDNSMLLDYEIELFMDGLSDGVDSPLTLSDRLMLLRSSRDAWRELKFRGISVLISAELWNAYELVDGVFAQTVNLVSANAARGIRFASLPSWNCSGAVIRYDDVGFAFRDFALDPTQNLVVYLQCESIPADDDGAQHTNVNLYLRMMTPNMPHPRARRPVISLTIRGGVDGAVVQVVDDVVGFLSWDEQGSRLHIWDWTQASLLVNKPNLSRLNDFAFISSRAFALTEPHHPPRFDLYTFSTASHPIEINEDEDDDEDEDDVDDDSIASEPDEDVRSGARLRARLYLPRPCQDAQVGILGIHTGPFVTPNPAPACLRPPKPFFTAPNARIHVVNADLYAADGVSVVSCLIVIHNSTFLTYINASIGKDAILDVPWSDWGVKNTYWIMGSTGSQWLRYVQGERLVRLQRTVEGEQLEVYDFGAFRGARRWLPADDAAGQRNHLELDKVFEESVSFEMGCRVAVRSQPHQYSGILIDEDKLIGVKRHEYAGNIDVFVVDAHT